MKNITNALVKALFLSLCSIFYFLEAFFYYTFTSPVDPGFEENQVGDLRVMLILCFIKIAIIITYILVLNKLKLKYLNSYILIFAFSIATVGVILPTIQYAHDLNIIVAMRIFIPIILNVVIAAVLGRYLLKVRSLSKRAQ